MEQSQLPPQPGSPEDAPRLLPLGSLGASLLGGVVFCIVATLSFVWLASGIFSERFTGIDDSLILSLNRYWGPGLNQVMLFFTTMGDPFVLTTFVVLITLALLFKRRWIDASAIALASAGGGIINQLLKVFYQRVRPDLVESPFHLTSYSFPSGHSMGSITCYGILAYIALRLMHRRASKVALVLFAALLVIGVGISRIYFAVHYPTDIVGGFLAGAIWLVISVLFLRAAEWHAQRNARRQTAS